MPLSFNTYFILFLCSLGGVPVFKRPIVKPRSSIVLAKPIEGASPFLPASFTVNPMLMQPRKNVPAVRITLDEVILVPS